MHLTDAYLAAARSANAERAQDYQQAGLDAPENLFPETFQELEEAGLSPGELMGGEGTEIIEQSDRGFTVAGSGEYDEAEASADWPLEVNRDDPEWVRYLFSMEIEEMGSDMDLTDLDQLRADGLGPKPLIETTDEPLESDADDLGTLIVTDILGEMFGALPDMSVELDGWYAERVLLASGLPVMTYWVELPGEVVSHQFNGQTAGTVDPATNRATLVIDEAFMRAHPEGTVGVWLVESKVHVCEEKCITEPHMIWDEISGPEECVCTCEEPGWTLDETGTICVEKAAEQPKHFIGNPANLEAILRARGYSEAHCPAGAAYPTGTVFLWSLSGGIAHSSVMAADNRQIEMGHKSGGEKYVSELLPAGQAPSANRGPYTLTRALCPPPGYSLESGGVASMAGVDRNYGKGAPDEWNCHGFSANVTARDARTGIEIRPGSRYRWEGNRLILEQGEVHIRDNSAIQVEVVGGKVFHHSEFVVEARKDGTARVAVLAGEVIFEGPRESVTLRADQGCEVDASGTPTAPESLSRSDLAAWWVSGELVQLSSPEPSLADFRAFEAGEIEELPGVGEAEGSGPRIPTVLLAGCGVALALGAVALVVGGVVAWRLTLRGKTPAPPAPQSSPSPPAAWLTPFARAEQRRAELEADLRAGRLDRGAFEAAMRQLIVQDQDGQYWALGGDDGAWYWYDGSGWVRRDPRR